MRGHNVTMHIKENYYIFMPFFCGTQAIRDMSLGNDSLVFPD